MWQMAAPALAAPMQASAISSGVTGGAGLCARVGKVPVTAQVRMVGFMGCSSCFAASRTHLMLRRDCDTFSPSVGLRKVRLEALRVAESAWR